VLILHTFMVIVVVSETVLLAIVCMCNCVHCSLLFSSIFVLHSLRIKVYLLFKASKTFLFAHYQAQRIERIRNIMTMRYIN